MKKILRKLESWIWGKKIVERQVVTAAMIEEFVRNFEKRQEDPFQYIVAYYKVADDSLIGYHLSTFNQVTPNINQAKRYQGENPYKQLGVISNNLKGTLTDPNIGLFAELYESIKKKDFQGLKFEEVYIDAVYLHEPPKQSLHIQIIN